MYDSDVTFHKNFISCNLNGIFDCLSSYSKSLPRRYQLAIDSLRKNKFIRICSADKGGKTVILNHKDYVEKMLDIFSDQDTYRKVSSNPLPLMQRKFNNGLKSLLSNRFV